MNCDHRFDIFQHFTDDALTDCPKCGKPALHKVYSPVGIVFKGSGFYCTDNHSPSGQPPVEHKSSVESDITPSSSEKPAEGSKKSESPAAPAAESKSTADKA